MSPDAANVSRQIDRLVARARVAAALEAAGFGALVAVWSVPVGFGVAVFVAVAQARAAARRAIVRRLERANPAMRNVVVTAEELREGSLSAGPHVAARVFHDAAAAMAGADTSLVLRTRRIVALLALVAGVWAAVRVVSGRAPAAPAVGDRLPGRSSGGSPVASGALQVTVLVRPPSYTGLPSSTASNPPDLRVVENSELEFSIRTGAGNVALDVNGTRRTPVRSSGGGFLDRSVATQSGFVIVTADDGARRSIALTVVPDALPDVRIVAPGKDLVFGSGNPRIAFEVRGHDDYGLKAMTLRFTKVSGSGELFEFSDSDVPLSIDRTSAVAWTGTAARTLRDFGLAEGDMLVYRAVASDNRPGAGEASSDAFFIEMSRLGIAAGDAFTLPEEETRYALSQQMLVVKTGRLIASRGSLGADFAETARGLAVEQRMIRSEFVFMLGGEIEDEAIEAEQSTELQEGRLANRGQRDLRDATLAMSQAEKHLTDANPEAALVAERAAIAALQRAFARDRYILRSLATRTPLDRTRRLTGRIDEAIGWRRQLRAADENRMARRLADLLEGLGGLSGGAGGAGERGVERRLSMFAELSVRINPESAVMRQAAAGLQTLADSWPSLDPAERARRLERVESAILAETRRTMADPPAAVGVGR